MSVQVFCPKCDRSCRIKEELLGKRVRCPGCQEIFKAEEVPIADIDGEAEDLPDFTPDLPPKREVGDEQKRPAKVKETKPPPPVHVSPDNPFDDAARLAAAVPVNPAEFDFDYGAPIEPSAKKKGDSDRKRTRQDEEDDHPGTKKKSPDTEHAWGKKKPPDELTSRTAIPALRDNADKKPKKVHGEPEGAAPFAFGEDLPTVKPHAPARRYEEDDEQPTRAPVKKKPTVVNDDADFLGLQDMDNALPAKPEKKLRSESRQYFHARQGGARLFRVFIHDGKLVFVTAAVGKDIAAMEAALESGLMDECERKIRNKILDLDELPIDELADEDPDSLRYSAAKFVAVAIDPPPRKLLRKGFVQLRLEHASKGEMHFDLPLNDEVDRALEFLPDLFDDVLEVHVKWDKGKEAYVVRS